MSAAPHKCEFFALRGECIHRCMTARICTGHCDKCGENKPALLCDDLLRDKACPCGRAKAFTITEHDKHMGAVGCLVPKEYTDKPYAWQKGYADFVLFGMDARNPYRHGLLQNMQHATCWMVGRLCAWHEVSPALRPHLRRRVANSFLDSKDRALLQRDDYNIVARAINACYGVQQSPKRVITIETDPVLDASSGVITR